MSDFDWPKESVELRDKALLSWAAFMPFDRAEQMLNELAEFVIHMRDKPGRK